MTTLHLYEMGPAYRALVGLMEKGEEGWEAAIEELHGDFEEKAINLAKLMNTWKAEEDVYDTEIKRLQTHKQAAGHRRSWAADYLRTNMEQAGIEHIKGDVVDIRLQNSPKSVVVENEDIIPEQYRTGTIRLSWAELIALQIEDRAQPEIDKRNILLSFEVTGETIPGVQVVQGTYIRIR